MRNGKIVIYLSGPMSGYENCNYDEFNRVTKILRDAGYIVLNPVEFDTPDFIKTNPTWRDYLKRDLQGMLAEEDVDMVALLNKWNPSRGSKAEVFMGKEILGADICKFNENKTGFTLDPIEVDTEVREVA
jgi:hypothetical protein